MPKQHIWLTLISLKFWNLKFDANGNPLLKHMQTDFSNAVRCLWNTAGFMVRSFFDDTSAHFIIQKVWKLNRFPSSQSQHGGENKQSLWICMRALKHFIIMANTCNSFLICEYFLKIWNKSWLNTICTKWSRDQTMNCAQI